MNASGGTGAAFQTGAAHSDRFFLWSRNRERGQGRSNETNNLDPARKLWGAADIKNDKNSRLEVMEKSGVLCVGMCVRPLCAISVYCQFLVDAVEWSHMQSFESDYMQQNTENTCREMWSCAGMHSHMNTHEHSSTVMCSLILMFIIKAGVGARAYLQVGGHSGGISWLTQRSGHLWESVALQRCKNKENPKWTHWTNKEE